MSIGEGERHALHARLADVLGRSEAATLMSYLPPVGWADVATKHDVAALAERIDLRAAVVNARFDALEARFQAVESRFEAFESRFEAFESRFEALESRFEAVDARFESVEGRLSGFATREDLARELHAQTRRILAWVLGVLVTYSSVAVAVLAR